MSQAEQEQPENLRELSFGLKMSACIVSHPSEDRPRPDVNSTWDLPVIL